MNKWKRESSRRWSKADSGSFFQVPKCNGAFWLLNDVKESSFPPFESRVDLLCDLCSQAFPSPTLVSPLIQMPQWDRFTWSYWELLQQQMNPLDRTQGKRAVCVTVHPELSPFCLSEEGYFLEENIFLLLLSECCCLLSPCVSGTWCAQNQTSTWDRIPVNRRHLPHLLSIKWMNTAQQSFLVVPPHAMRVSNRWTVHWRSSGEHYPMQSGGRLIWERKQQGAGNRSAGCVWGRETILEAASLCLPSYSSWVYLTWPGATGLRSIKQRTPKKKFLLSKFGAKVVNSILGVEWDNTADDWCVNRHRIDLHKGEKIILSCKNIFGLHKDNMLPRFCWVVLL